MRWLEARRFIRRRGPGPYTPWVITTAGRAAHQWGHYTLLHGVRGTTRILTLAELEPTYVVLTGMLERLQLAVPLGCRRRASPCGSAGHVVNVASHR